MKKTLLLATLIITMFTIMVAAPVFALDITGKLSNVGTAAGFTEKEPNLAQTVGKIIQGLLSLLGIIFMAYIIYAGFLWMTARGKDETIEKAKAIIRGCIIGIIVVLGAYAITSFVVSRVGSATGYSSETQS